MLIQKMSLKRYEKLMSNPEEELTTEEKKEGWHRCNDWDFLLIGPGCPELESCTCKKVSDAV
jgi:hypothetical protein